MQFQKLSQEILECGQSLNVSFLKTYCTHYIVLYSILPYVNYGVLIWGNTCKICLDKKTPEMGYHNAIK